MTTLIVLDTTETFGDVRLEGPDYAFLRNYVSRYPVTLVIPQIVVEETVNHFREQLDAEIDQARSSFRAIGRLSPKLVEKIKIECDFNQEVSAFREHLQKQLKSLLAKQPSYEGIRISSLVDRALARRKPFDKKGGAGFRDALIWESVLTCILNENPTEVILITRNKHDFGEHGGLVDDIAADLASHGLSPKTVIVCEGLQRFVNERVKPSLEKLDEIGRKLNDGEYLEFNPMKFFEETGDGIRDELVDKVVCLDLNRLNSTSVWGYRRPFLDFVENSPDQYNVFDVQRISPNELGIGIEFDVPGGISCQRETRMGPYGEPWHEEFAGRVNFILFMTLVFDEKAKKVESWEVNELEVVLTSDWG